ncbi:polyphenol oxidase family protein [Kocuria sp. CPCC 205297]|uniref:polyphenol oxidase family protein n=1 Tax=Kocuria sp. CPCC 205297 TaxID=3073558 RepID=UPI0034D6C5DE
MWFRSEHHGVGIAFTDATEGNLATHTGDDPAVVRQRRHTLERELGPGARGVHFVHQVHGTTVHDATGTDVPEQAPEADAAVSTDGTPLGILTADCLPVVFVGRTDDDAAAPVLAVAHAGRKGLLDGVLQHTLGALEDRGATGITAWIGPAVCGDCYEVPAKMAEAAEAALPGIATTTAWGTPGLDLPSAADALLRERGVTVATASTDRTTWCTLEHPALYSYRRDTTAQRLAGLVWARNGRGTA